VIPFYWAAARLQSPERDRFVISIDPGGRMFATVAGRMQVRNTAGVILLDEAELVTLAQLSARARTFAVRLTGW
jgi:hypothetical protein